jgi:hypothetical protein
MITKKLRITNNNFQSEPFITADLSLASSLLTLGFNIWNLDRSNPKKSQFIFQRSPGLDLAVQKYWNGKLKMNPRLFADNQKMLKNRLYSRESYDF